MCFAYSIHLKILVQHLKMSKFKVWPLQMAIFYLKMSSQFYNFSLFNSETRANGFGGIAILKTRADLMELNFQNISLKSMLATSIQIIKVKMCYAGVIFGFKVFPNCKNGTCLKKSPWNAYYFKTVHFFQKRGCKFDFEPKMIKKTIFLFFPQKIEIGTRFWKEDAF